MSLQWTFIATFLYIEIALVVLFMLPFISAYRWQQIFRSRLLSSFRYYANIYFNIFIAVLIILFLDSVRDVRRYSESHTDEVDLRNNPSAEAVLHMKLFRAQRNFYIAGFALFLFLVLRRMVVLISQHATLEAEREASLKQAENASEMAKKLMEEKDNKANEKKDDPKMAKVVDGAVASNASQKELDETRLQLERTREELHRANLDLETMRKQAQSTGKEYDRLMQEHASLQTKVKTMDGSGETKKDN